MDNLRHVIRTYPVIDNHAHNLLQPDQLSKHDFLTSTTEAQGEALRDTPTSLSHIRALKQLKELYGVEEDNWDAISVARTSRLSSDSDGLIKICLEGTYTILMDDGLDNDSVLPYSWHDQFVMSPVKRIVRIEAVVEELVRSEIAPEYQKNVKNSQRMFSAFESFRSAIKKGINTAIRDPAVAGFKSVICYRTGLSIGNVDNDQIVTAFRHYLDEGEKSGSYRLESKPLNDWLVRFLLDQISQSGSKTPVQFHTGLGDNDINLLLSDPSHLQPLIEEYANVPFIILHSSYPFTRSAGYLATVYSNAYLDVGEVFPMISRDGQEKVIRQALELVPGSKLLWSTDGHHFPETYWLANKQFRAALEKILVEYVNEGDLSTDQAAQLVRDIFFNNSNRVYDLNLEPPASSGTGLSRPAAPTPGMPAPDRDSNDVSIVTSYDATIWKAFSAQNPEPAYIYVQWLDRMGQLRCRVVPSKEFARLIATGAQLGMSRGNTGTLQNDAATSVMNNIGQIGIRPDLRSLRPTHSQDTLRKPGKASGMVMASWCDDEGQPLDYCHRSRVQRLVADIKHEFNVSLLVGFEIEITFFRRDLQGKATIPFASNQAWSTLTTQIWDQMTFFGSIVDALAEMGIHLQQFHTESAQGQMEFVLPPLPPLLAIDTLVQARVAIQQLAYKHDPELRATLHPVPSPGIGTGAHAHISLTPPDLQQQFFVGGVLEHLRAVCAFTLSEKPSYDRVVDDSWTCGSWACWGTQNRETPLRKVGGNSGRWEVRCLDGCANMYLAVGAIFAAGLLGLRAGSEGRAKDCQFNPSKLDDSKREELGIRERLPRKLEESLAALSADQELTEVLGREMVEDYLVMKEAEQKILEAMSEDQRRVWLVERY